MTIRHHDDPHANGLYRAILERPHDLLVRRVYADRLDDIGETERAEFIRLQCGPGHDRELVRHLRMRLFTDTGGVIHCTDDCNHLVAPSDVVFLLRNGLVDEIRLGEDGLRWWLGGECACGDGRIYVGGAGGRIVQPEEMDTCPTCHGTGRMPGHGAEVVSRHPVTRVVATDREPLHITFRCLSQGNYRWLRRLEYGSPAFLPDELFWRIKGRRVGDFAVDYPTREAAAEALSRALVDLARERAGLPPITWEPSADPVKQNWHSPLRYEA